jgi:hypothetical protein
VRSTKLELNQSARDANPVELSSLWIFVAIVLCAFACYGVLLVHLLLDATRASVWGLLWMTIPIVFACGSVSALFIASGMPLREKVAAIPAGLLGYSPRQRPDPQTAPSLAARHRD